MVLPKRVNASSFPNVNRIFESSDSIKPENYLAFFIENIKETNNSHIIRSRFRVSVVRRIEVEKE